MTYIEGGQMALILPGEELAGAVADAARFGMAIELRRGAQEASDYIDRYALQLVTNRASWERPLAPMHSKLEELARELCRDQAVLLRRGV